MLDLIQQFVRDNTTPELAQSINDAYTVLLAMGADNLNAPLEEIVMLDDVSDAHSAIGKMVTLLKEAQEDLLTSHEITLNDDTSLETRTLFLRGLLTLPEYEDVSTIGQVLAIEQERAETLSQLLSLVTAKTTDELLAYVTDVGQSLLTRLGELTGVQEGEIITEEERTEREHHLHLINRFCHYTRSRQYHLIELLANGMAVGYPYTVYADLVGREFEGIVAEQIAKEMLLMALASSDGCKNPRTVIKPNMERYIASMNVITRVDIELNRLLAGFEL